jgi:RNA-directed DNA polymerase
LAADKTVITPIDKGCDFLGQHVRKYHGKRRIKPSRKRITSLLGKGRESIQVNKPTSAGQRIGQLQPRWRGGANEHRHVVSKVICAKRDQAIFQALWRWAKRRHPHKPPGGLRRKSCTGVADHRGVFSGTTITSHGETREPRLRRWADTPITRHSKVNAAANPSDPTWARDFEARLGVQMADTLKGRRRLLDLWRAPDGHGPGCQQPITQLTGWHNHHRVWRSKGGGRRRGQSGVAAPQLSPARPSPWEGRGQAASPQGRSKGLSGLRGNASEPL